MSRKERLPPSPRFEPFQQGSDKAVSDAIQKMTGDDKQAVYLLAKLTVRDKHRLSPLESIAQDFKFSFLSSYIMAYCTFSAAEEGKRSDQITTIVKNPEISLENGSGFFGNLKNRLHI